MPHSTFPLAILVLLACAFAARTVWVKRAIGKPPTTFGATDSAHDHLGRVFRVTIALLFVWFGARTLWPGADIGVGTPALLHRTLVVWPGVAIMAGGALLTIAAQLRMGRSWRIGVDSDKTALITTGLFAISRNPVFVGMLAVLVGGFLTAPSSVTIALCGAIWVAISTQIRLEEAQLTELHGEAYAHYCAATRRWL